MAETASDVLVSILEDWGVDTVFGLPGDGVNGVIEALRKKKDRIRFIHVRHEECAAFAATSYAKYTGRLGVCLATSGPGAIHLLNGLYDAKLDQQPVLAISGMQFHDLTNTFSQQDVEVDKLFMDVAAYNVRIMGPNHIESATELACRHALTNRSVSSITIPVDFQDMELKKGERSKRNVKGHARSEDLSAHQKRSPGREMLERAAEVLNAGKKVAIMAGRGALNCVDELEALAEKLGAPIIKPLLGKAAVPDDSPYTTGGIGLLGTKPSQEALEECDTLFLVGTSFPYMEFLPRPGKARAVQVDINPIRIGLRYPVEVGLVGDTRSTLRELLPLLKRNAGRGFLEEMQAGMRDWRKLMEKRADVSTTPLKPQVLAKEISLRLKNDAIVNCDSGTITTWWARHIIAKRGQMHSVSGTLATMACGVPYAIGAQAAYPDRQVVAFIGDGSASMLMGEFATAVQNKLPIKVFVVKNNTLGQIKWEQMAFLGNPEYVCDLSPINFAEVARACGAQGFSIDKPDNCGEIVERALNTPGPVVVEALVDINEPPTPPKITAEQALHFAEAMARGTKDAHKIIATVMEDKIRELV
jgi:pyruvate dehydrogenase (quinone)